MVEDGAYPEEAHDGCDVFGPTPAKV
jgi:hypothetical protein